nr:MAG TPA: hypothetical protein [Caudoviricetes sp.]
MQNLVVYGKGVNHFFSKEGYLNSAEQLIKVCETIEEAEELANHLNKVLRGERLPFKGYSVVYGKGVESFFIIEGNKVNSCELFIESFDSKEEARKKRDELNKKNELENM